jgi:hypothetical protein
MNDEATQRVQQRTGFDGNSDGLVHRPSPSIAHLLLLTACVATLLQSHDGVGDWIREASIMQLVVGILGFFTILVIQGLWRATVVVAVWRWFQRLAFPTEPGEWLMCAAGCVTWMNGLLQWLPFRSDYSPEYDAMDANARVAPMALVLLIGAVCMWPSRFWSACFVCIAMFGLIASTEHYLTFKLSIPHDILNVAQFVLGGAICLTLMVGIVLDFVRHTRRGWVHWLGICSFAVGIVVVILMVNVQPFSV